jgi:hypothetical protein
LLTAFREMLLRRKLGDPIFVVSGLPRSGTSMMMRMLEAGGVEIVSDHVRTADEDNPKGYFELERVKDLDKDPDKSWLRECRGKVVKIISFLLRDLPDDNFYKIVFLRRNLEEIMASQNKMLVRRGEPTDESRDAEMMERYTFHLRKTEVQLEYRSNVRVLDVPYREVLDSPREQARRVRAFLGLKLDEEAMAAAVDPSLYRNRL